MYKLRPLLLEVIWLLPWRPFNVAADAAKQPRTSTWKGQRHLSGLLPAGSMSGRLPAGIKRSGHDESNTVQGVLSGAILLAEKLQ